MFDSTREIDPLAFLQGGGAMGELMRSRDWCHSELGPPEQWPAALKTAISAVLNSGTAMHISWGDNLLQFYNDGYLPILTDGKHPAALGRSVWETFAEISDFMTPLFDRVLYKGEAVAMENAGAMMYRDGVLMECFFNFSYSPLKSLSGEICGVAAVCWETTEDVLLRRRERGLHRLTEQLAAASTPAEVRHAVHCLAEGNRSDLPFLLYYERDEALKTLRLVEACGISRDAPLVRELGVHDESSELGQALDSSAPVARLVSLHEPVTGWLLDPPVGMQIPCIAIEPLCYANYSTPDAYLVFGVSAQRPSDGSLRKFHESICNGVERAVRRIAAVELERREGVRQFDAVMRLTLEAAHIGYWELDLLTRIPKRSVLHDQIFGYDELVADWSYERFLHHVLPQDREQVDRVFRTGVEPRAGWDIECRIIRRDGALRWIWLHGDMLADAAGNAVRAVGIIVDITDRKNTEEAMRESEQRFASAFEHAPIGKALVALDGRYLQVNRALCTFLGYSSAELLASTFQALTHPDDIAPDMDMVRRMLSGEICTYQIEKRYIHASGRCLSALLSVSLVLADDGQPRYFISQVQDITESRAAEQAVERAMQRLSNAQSMAKIGDWEYEVATQAVTWSPQVFTIFGRDPSLGPPPDYVTNAALYDAASRPLLEQKVGLAIEAGQPQECELVAQRPDCAPVNLHLVVVPIKDESGQVTRLHGTVQDISGRRQAEAESLKLAHRLTSTLDSMSDGFYMVDRDWRFTFLNEQAELLLGRGREELLGRNIWAEFPTAVGTVFEREYRRALADNVTVAFEEYFGFLDGSFSVRGYPSEQGLAVYFSDITEARRAAEALRASEAEFRKLAEAMPQIVWTARADGRNTYFNQQWSDYTGLTLDDSLENGWSRPFHPDDRNRALESWKNATETLGPYSMESRLRRADGVYRWWLIRAVPVQDADGRVSKWFGTCTDIHDLRESEIRVKRLNRVYAMVSQISALIVRKPGRDELFREACRVAVELGELRFAWVGLADRGADLINPVAAAGGVDDFFECVPREVFNCQPGTASRVAQALHEREPQVVNDLAPGRHVLIKEDMEKRGVRSFAVIPLVVHGEAVGAFALYAEEAGFFDEEEMRLLEELAANISLALENLEKQERLDYLAYYDPLTGLANRTLFLDRLSQHIRSAASDGHQLALFLFDLERFKNINDSLGRSAGDALLKQVGDWLTLRTGDARLLARMGPNHFAAVMPQVKPGGDLARLIENAMALLSRHPFKLDGAVLRVTAKVGAAVFPADGATAEVLFQNAEAALRHAKAGGDRYLLHNSLMTATTAGKLSLENQLRRALDNEEFVLHYQPKVNLASGQVVGAEALIRWNDPDSGLVPPGKFIPVLEETGLIHEVGRWAMRKAIEDHLRWCDAGLSAVRIAVNVSSLQLRSRGFVAEVAQALEIDPRAASGLELEITESMVMGNIDHGIASLQAIRAMGVTIALDDFGTGFSSLSYLACLPIDTLKIDRSFINDMDGTPEGLALVSTIITLARSLRHKVVAEGVETAEQARLLRLLACDEMQGFHFGKPAPTGDFEASYLAPSKR